MKTRLVAVRKKERLPVSIPCVKENGIRKIDKEERDKRIGLSLEKIKELEKSSQAFFQAMLQKNGNVFWFKWQKGDTDPLGFRFNPYWINNIMWFLFSNTLEELLQNNVKAAQAIDSFRWMIKERIADPWFCVEQYFDNEEMYIRWLPPCSLQCPQWRSKIRKILKKPKLK